MLSQGRFLGFFVAFLLAFTLENAMSDLALPPLIRQMLQPQFYPHAVTEPIQLVQTHVSYVLLTGEYAYKLKKPVNFGFLDYSTLARRKHFCQEELRLNQRAAAVLYLAVVPILEVAGQFALGTAEDSLGETVGELIGEPVEYAVQMRQFPQTSLLSAYFARGELSEALLLQLAAAIAQFHQQAETSDYIRTFGAAAQVRLAIDENYEQTTAYVGGPQTQAQFDQTRAYSDRFFADQTALFERRMAQGKIRACHGDLHLNNICYWQDQLLLFDCIEFNEPFRFVDVMFDIAYIVMDLEAKGRTDLSAVFLSHYVEQTGDWEGLQILPLYVSRQAYVRAKVTSFLLDDPSVDPAAKQQAAATAAQYYHLAWSYVQPRPTTLLIMVGLSGSGKSTTARELSRQAGAIQLRSDAVRKHLAGVALTARGNQAIYSPEMSQRTYERLLELAIGLIQAGYSVVLDAKYDQQAARQAVIEWAEAAAQPLRIIYCTAPLATLQARLTARQGDIADATVDVLATQVMEPFTPQEQSFVITVDTTGELAGQAARIISNSREQPSTPD